MKTSLEQIRAVKTNGGKIGGTGRYETHTT